MLKSLRIPVFKNKIGISFFYLNADTYFSKDK